MDLLEKITQQRAEVIASMKARATEDGFDPDTDTGYRDDKALVARLGRQADAIREAKQFEVTQDEMRDLLVRAPARHGDPTRDLGEQVIRSDAWQTYVRNGAGGRAHLMDLDLHRRALITSSFAGSGETQLVAAPPAVQTPLLNALGNVQVPGGAYSVLTYPAAAPLAGIVAEGAQKPEATFTSSEATGKLDTIAHWAEVTRRAIADSAALRDFLSQGLLRGVYDKAEAEAATVIQGGTYATVAGADMLEAIRLGVAAVQEAGFRPNAVLINPTDAAGLDFAIWALPGGGGVSQNNSIFGLSLIPVSSIAAGTAFIGDFQIGAKWLYRGSAQLYVTDSDVGIVATAAVSNFKRNVLTFLAEMDAKTVITQPAAIVEATPTPGALLRGGGGPAGRTGGGGGGGGPEPRRGAVEPGRPGNGRG